MRKRAGRARWASSGMIEGGLIFAVKVLSLLRVRVR
jgi:hypothetical protein